MNSLSKIQNKQLTGALGYQFKDESLLLTALSHRSVGPQNNERFEFLGDSLLNFIIAEALFEKFPAAPEGDLTRVRASLVKGETLAEIARGFQLGEYLQLGEGELKSGGYRRASILADAVEAILGAIYLESGMVVCREVVLSWFRKRLSEVSPSHTGKDAKTRLQEYLQERKQALPVYKVINRLGQAHAPQFEVSCEIGQGHPPQSAVASSKRLAEKLAAEKMLAHLGVA